MSEWIQVENQWYLPVNSTLTDDRVRILNHADTFGIFDRWGDVHPIGAELQGIYHRGMRYVSELALRLNGVRPLLLSSSVKEENEILSIDLTNPPLTSAKGIQKDTLYLGRSRFIRNGACYEKIRICNYGTEACSFQISLSFDADFKDIFEVRGIKREKRGRICEMRSISESEANICYEGLDGAPRSTWLNFVTPPTRWERPNRACFEMELLPHQETALEFALYFTEGTEKPHVLSYAEAQQSLHTELKKSSRLLPAIDTSHQQFNGWINRSRSDLLSLLSTTPQGLYPYAGVPWYNTAFGRDGIITALETLWIAPDIGRDVLRFLAHTQAREENPYLDAEPGKIIHEVRRGEMAQLGEIPFRRYYGSVDATPLFVMLAGAYYSRTADKAFIETIWEPIKAALRWIDEYGDVDRDGFVEYAHKSAQGLTNQGWKDSHDSVMHHDGRLAASPIALCEVQAYVYDAKCQGAMLARVMGEQALAHQLEQQAMHLKEQFNEQFWDEELQGYVLALDGEKKPCRVVSSNQGHCLLTSIVPEERAVKIARRLFAPDLFSGWGVRTLSKNEKRYNPMSYHNGSVWPHDVALIARGLSKYGFAEETLRLTRSLFEASLYIDLQRLPELFCGFDRRKGEGPTSYPVACSPQAWSVGAVYLLLEACLHVDIYGLDKKVVFYKPQLPFNIEHLIIKGLKLGDHQAELTLSWDKGSVGIKVEHAPRDWQVLVIS